MLTYRQERRDTETGSRFISFYVPVLCDYYGQERIAVLPDPIFGLLFMPNEYGDVLGYKVTPGNIVTIRHHIAPLQRAVFMLADYTHASFTELEAMHADWEAMPETVLAGQFTTDPITTTTTNEGV